MTRREWTIAAAAVLGTAVLWILGLTVGARFAGYFVTLQRSGGNRTGTPLVQLPDTAARPEPPLAGVFETAPSKVILLIADGLGFSHLQAGRYALASPGGRLFLERFPSVGWMSTHALSTLRLDSASTASALASGRKVEYGQLSIDASNTVHRTIAEVAIENGFRVGLVTDSYLWDATVAAFLAHAQARGDYGLVASQLARSGADLLVGEAMQGEDLEAAGPRPGDAADFTANGFTVVRTWEALQRIPPSSGSRIVAILPHGVISDRARPPLLEDLARLALASLAAQSDRFFLVIETEETDSGSHRADFPRVMRGIEAIDNVSQIAADFALQNPDTLVLFTSDHETGGLTLLTGSAEEPMGVRWSTTVHTAEPVPVLAFGAGAERFVGVHDNVDLATTLAELLDLELRSEPNPEPVASPADH